MRTPYQFDYKPEYWRGPAHLQMPPPTYAGPLYQAPGSTTNRDYQEESQAYAQQMAMYYAQQYPGAYPGAYPGYQGYPMVGAPGMYGMAPPPQFFNGPPEEYYEEEPRPQASQKRISSHGQGAKKKGGKKEWNPYFSK